MRVGGMLRAHMGKAKQRMGTVFGWIAGGSLGLVVNYAISLAWGPGYPLIPTTFGLFVLGCFGGMWASDRLGDRAFRVLGIAAGLLLALALTFVVAAMLTAPRR